MKKYAKMMKMSCQNVVPKCANVTTISKTKLSLPYLKVTFQGFMGLRISNHCHRGWQIAFYCPTINPTFNPTANILPATYTTGELMPPLIGNNAFQFNSDIHTMKLSQYAKGRGINFVWYNVTGALREQGDEKSILSVSMAIIAHSKLHKSLESDF